MNVSLSIAIMAVPSRTEPARRLVHTLLDQIEPLLHDHAIHLPVVSFDTLLQGPRIGAAKAWALAFPDATHHLVIQDDAVLSRDFLPRVLEALTARPASFLSFQLARAVTLRELPHPCWVKPAAIVGAVALAMPRTMALAASQFLLKSPGRNDDDVLTRFVRERNVDHVIAVPSLVQHGDLPSTAKHDSYRHMLVAQKFYDDLTDEAKQFAWSDAVEISLV